MATKEEYLKYFYDENAKEMNKLIRAFEKLRKGIDVPADLDEIEVSARTMNVNLYVIELLRSVV